MNKTATRYAHVQVAHGLRSRPLVMPGSLYALPVRWSRYRCEHHSRKATALGFSWVHQVGSYVWDGASVHRRRDPGLGQHPVRWLVGWLASFSAVSGSLVRRFRRLGCVSCLGAPAGSLAPRLGRFGTSVARRFRRCLCCGRLCGMPVLDSAVSAVWWPSGSAGWQFG